MPSATCQANPPCQIGGWIEVEGAAIQLAPDVEVAGVGENRIVGRGGANWYSIYAMPEDFKLSGPSTPQLREDWAQRKQAEWEAGQGPNATGVVGEIPASYLLAGAGLLTLVVIGLAARRGGAARD